MLACRRRASRQLLHERGHAHADDVDAVRRGIRRLAPDSQVPEVGAQVRSGAWMLPAMTRWLVLVCALASACGGGENHTPVTPTPIGLSLPPGAPSDAAAKPGTTRITITAVEIVGADGARVTPDRLKVTSTSVSYNMRVWIFCPSGLEGPQGSGWNAEVLEYQIRKGDPA